jgi:two-component system chemotaxis response regulator CheB
VTGGPIITREVDPLNPEIGVLLAGGSVLSRRAVRTHLSFDPRFVVVGEARSRDDLVALAGRLHPSAVVLDPDLTLGALPALAELMATHPVPVVVYGDGELADPAVQADLRAAGAVDVVIRPRTESDSEARSSAAGDELRSCLRLAARIRVIRHPRGRLPTLAPKSPVTPSTPVVVIGASTGGPSALGVLLAGLPRDLNAAVLVVQHMPVNFVSGLAGWLDNCGPLPVKLGVDGILLCPGEIVVCPGGQDSLLEPVAGLETGPAAGRLRCVQPQAVAHHVPSVDRAFTSVAATIGARAVGVILTGMGRDGAAGITALHAAGGMTIAQDEHTSAIYGMPQAAVEAGAVDHVLPLPEIADAIAALVTMAHQRMPT